jgi:hypothetical protein
MDEADLLVILVKGWKGGWDLVSMKREKEKFNVGRVMAELWCACLRATAENTNKCTSSLGQKCAFRIPAQEKC